MKILPTSCDTAAELREPSWVSERGVERVNESALFTYLNALGGIECDDFAGDARTVQVELAQWVTVTPPVVERTPTIVCVAIGNDELRLTGDQAAVLGELLMDAANKVRREAEDEEAENVERDVEL